MAQQNPEGAGAAVKPSLKKTPHDHRVLPDGRKIGDVKDLGPMFVRLGIPGAEVSSGRETLINAYAKHLETIRQAGADQAESAWLADKRSAL